MKLHEIADDDFSEPTQKSLSTQQKLTRAENQLMAVKHEIQLLDKMTRQVLHSLSGQYKYTGHDESNMTGELMSGGVKYTGPRTSLEQPDSASYLTIFRANNDPVVRRMQKIHRSKGELLKIEKSLKLKIPTLKRNLKKESGTYVSTADVWKMEVAIQKILEPVLQNIYTKPFTINRGSTKTRKSGESLVNIGVEASHLKNANLAVQGNWKQMKEQAKTAIQNELNKMGITPVRILQKSHLSDDKSHYEVAFKVIFSTEQMIAAFKK
jgi:hypothetical protein